MRIRILLCVLLALTHELWAEDPVPSESASKDLQKLYQSDAEAYEFFADAAKKQPLTFVSKPLMHWASPDDWSGDVFVWTNRGRPEIVGCMLSGPATGGRLIFHEFHALTLSPMPTQQLGGGRTWALDKPAIELQLLKDAPLPAETPAARLTQMRALSREFSVVMQAGEQPWELRLLPQPIYRYERPEDERGWLDGGLFTWVWTTGTDAEVLLLLEARMHEGEYRWHYTPVRLTNREVTMKHHDRVIWQVSAHTEQGSAVTRPYTTFYVRTTMTKTTTE
jgi:hypothetical protein